MECSPIKLYHYPNSRYNATAHKLGNRERNLTFPYRDGAWLTVALDVQQGVALIYLRGLIWWKCLHFISIHIHARFIYPYDLKTYGYSRRANAATIRFVRISK